MIPKQGKLAMKYLEYSLEYSPRSGVPEMARPSRSEEQAYISRMVNTLVGSLGVDEAMACVTRHHWVGLLPLVAARVGVICPDR